MRFLNRSINICQGLALMKGHRRLIHDFLNHDALHDVKVMALFKMNTFFSQFDRIDGIRLQPLGNT